MANSYVQLVTQISSNPATKQQSETLNVRVNYHYKGPAKQAYVGAVVTQSNISEFDEIGTARKEVAISLPDAQTEELLYTNITGIPLSGCSPKSGYGIKVYFKELGFKSEWGCKNVLTITGETVQPVVTVASITLS